jgi:hypothetical protein
VEVLVINIDRGNRSVYTGAMVASLVAKLPVLRVTALLSTEARGLERITGLERVEYLDTGEFFARTKDLPNDEVERELRAALGDLVEQRWEVVINLSSNLLGSLLASYLEGKQLKGTYIDPEGRRVAHSDGYSYQLAVIPDDERNFLHFTFLYRGIFRRFERVRLAPVWEPRLEGEFRQHLTSMMHETGRHKLVLLDGRLSIFGGQSTALLAGLYASLASAPDFQPVLLVDGTGEESPALQRLRREVVGDIQIVQSDPAALLTLVGAMSAVVTDDLTLKAIADVVGRPSLLFTDRPETNEFSSHPGSVQVVGTGAEPKLIDGCMTLVLRMVMGVDGATRLEAYESYLHQEVPLLRPLGDGVHPEYLEWLIGTRLFMYLGGLSLPPLTADKTAYRRLVRREQAVMRGKTREGLYSFVVGMAQVPAAATFFKAGHDPLVELPDFFLAELS